VPNPVIVWDAPTRLFHWILVLLIAFQYASGEFGLLPMEWHFRLGYATLALIVFRVLWGFAGSPSSRFSSFVRSPAVVARYLLDILRGRQRSYPGHNPLGGWSVLLMLACIAVQAISGLFSSDDLTLTGPLAARVSDRTVELMTRIHHLGRYVLLALIVLHLMAVLMHWAIGRDNLVAPMLHGRKQLDGAEDVRPASPLRALALAAVSAAAVWTVVVWGGSG
jgi:cytochrome b